MRRILCLLGIGLLTASVPLGCQSDVAPSPGPARIPGPDERRLSDEGARAKPLPPQDPSGLPPPPFDDVPLVSQQAPETPRFVEAYEKVGRPRIVVWVSHRAGYSYEEPAARAIDYAAMENILTDWLSADGHVAVISPEAARQVLSVQQVQDLNSTRPTSTQEIGDKLRADVLVIVQAQPTRQSSDAPAVRLVADASNLKGAESIGRAVVDVPPPLDKPQINTYTRFVARKLMADMTNAWSNFGAASPPAGPGTQPEAAPAPPATQPMTDLQSNPYLTK